MEHSLGWHQKDENIMATMMTAVQETPLWAPAGGLLLCNLGHISIYTYVLDMIVFSEGGLCNKEVLQKLTFAATGDNLQSELFHALSYPEDDSECDCVESNIMWVHTDLASMQVTVYSFAPLHVPITGCEFLLYGYLPGAPHSGADLKVILTESARDSDASPRLH